MTAPGQLRAFVERILQLKEEQDTISDDIREIYAEAKGSGFDKQALGQLVTYLRKKEKDGAKLEEQSAIFEAYREAYENHQPSHAHTRESRASKSPDPHPLAAPDGEPSIPSSDAAGAKIEVTSLVGQGGVSPIIADRESEQAVTDFEPPAFLKRDHQPLRPLCMCPDLCAGVGRNHCWSCLTAAGETEVA